MFLSSGRGGIVPASVHDDEGGRGGAPTSRTRRLPLHMPESPTPEPQALQPESKDMSELAVWLEQEAATLRSVALRGSDARAARALHAAHSPGPLGRRDEPDA
eukprot:11237895-Alexandrium_andersonii.AAC.1